MTPEALANLAARASNPLSYPCRRCGADRGAPCVTPGPHSRPRDPHMIRERAARDGAAMIADLRAWEREARS